MLKLEKKIIIEPGLFPGQFWLCGVALQKYLELITVRSTDTERTFYTSDKREKVYIRERDRCIHIRYHLFPTKPKWVSRKALDLGRIARPGRPPTSKAKAPTC